MIFHSKLKNRISHHVQSEDLPKQTIVHQTRFPQGAKMYISAILKKICMILVTTNFHNQITE